MKRVYLDNAATTPMLPEVIDTMITCMETTFGNPSSTHSFGRSAKSVIENSRKKIAKYIGCTTSEIVFTSGGTEADNFILKNAVQNLEVQHIITSSIEHHAILNTVDFLAQKNIKISYVNILNDGTLDYKHLQDLLNNCSLKTLVSLMHVNNETGSILDLNQILTLKVKYNFLFHSDTVQSIGHFNINLSDLNIDFITAAAHKFHGPKGIGFAFFRKGTGIIPEILGGEQERGSRAGTENTAAIVGMEKALSICIQNLTEDIFCLKELKKYLISELTSKIPELQFNSVSNDFEKSTHTILSIRCAKDFPLLLFQLDMKGIAVSGGSACQSGAHKGSHVLQSFLDDNDQLKTSLRVSLSKLTTKTEIDYFVNELVLLIKS